MYAAAWKITCGRKRCHDVAHAAVVEHVGDQEFDLHVFRKRPQSLFQKELSGFRAIDSQDPPRRELQQLPADFRADAARAAGHQHYLPVDPLADVVDIQFYRLALQKVFDRHGPGLHDQAAVDQLPVTGKHADFEIVLLSVVDKFAQFFSGKFSLNDENLLYRVAFDKPA